MDRLNPLEVLEVSEHITKLQDLIHRHHITQGFRNKTGTTLLLLTLFIASVLGFTLAAALTKWRGITLCVGVVSLVFLAFMIADTSVRSQMIGFISGSRAGSKKVWGHQVVTLLHRNLYEIPPAFLARYEQIIDEAFAVSGGVNLSIHNRPLYAATKDQIGSATKGARLLQAVNEAVRLLQLAAQELATARTVMSTGGFGDRKTKEVLDLCEEADVAGQAVLQVAAKVAIIFR
jgi:hypothetical protein